MVRTIPRNEALRIHRNVLAYLTPHEIARLFAVYGTERDLGNFVHRLPAKLNAADQDNARAATLGILVPSIEWNRSTGRLHYKPGPPLDQDNLYGIIVHYISHLVDFRSDLIEQFQGLHLQELESLAQGHLREDYPSKEAKDHGALNILWGLVADKRAAATHVAPLLKENSDAEIQRIREYLGDAAFLERTIQMYREWVDDVTSLVSEVDGLTQRNRAEIRRIFGDDFGFISRVGVNLSTYGPKDISEYDSSEYMGWIKIWNSRMQHVKQVGSGYFFLKCNLKALERLGKKAEEGVNETERLRTQLESAAAKVTAAEQAYAELKGSTDYEARRRLANRNVDLREQLAAARAGLAGLTETHRKLQEESAAKDEQIRVLEASLAYLQREDEGLDLSMYKGYRVVVVGGIVETERHLRRLMKDNGLPDGTFRVVGGRNGSDAQVREVVRGLYSGKSLVILAPCRDGHSACYGAKGIATSRGIDFAHSDGSFSNLNEQLVRYAREHITG